jgi:hypothetical protein
MQGYLTTPEPSTATCRELFTYHCYGIAAVALLNILVHLFTHWSIRFRAFASTSNLTDLDDAEVVLVVPVRFNGSTELVPLERKYVVSVEGSSVSGWGDGETGRLSPLYPAAGGGGCYLRGYLRSGD